MDYGRLVMSRRCQDSAGRGEPSRDETGGSEERELAKAFFSSSSLLQPVTAAVIDCTGGGGVREQNEGEEWRKEMKEDEYEE